LALSNQVVNSDHFKSEIKFSFDIISDIQIEKRNKIFSLIKVFAISKKLKFKKIIFGGYDNWETFLLPFFHPKQKNCLQFESSIFESKTVGIIAWIKWVLLKRYKIALPSGDNQCELLKELNFSGELIKTYGVGIFNRFNFDKIEKSKRIEDLKYLYVGRLINKKNLFLLVETFNQNKKPLEIVGSGFLLKELKSIANTNITFTEFVDNSQIYKYYLANDVFILPSIAEPWGLVIEEAIFYHLPVIISNKVGCQAEMVVKPNSGTIFNPNSKESLIDAINYVESNFDELRSNCAYFNFEIRDKMQVNAYLETCNL
jgi:glycosyltransferase involved in cell wall biosynthesis